MIEPTKWRIFIERQNPTQEDANEIFAVLASFENYDKAIIGTENGITIQHFDSPIVAEAVEQKINEVLENNND